jgi:hypothetical protein
MSAAFDDGRTGLAMEAMSAGEGRREYFSAGANAKRNQEGDKHQRFHGGLHDEKVLVAQARLEIGTNE